MRLTTAQATATTASPDATTTRAAATRPADPIEAPGTPEDVWAAWQGPAAFPEVDLAGLRDVVLVAAHPDDEVLGLGGTIARLAAAGVRLTLVAVTDGEASHPRSTAVTRRQLARTRRHETRRALEVLGASCTEIVHLGVPDTAVTDHEEWLTERLTRVCDGADVLAAPWSGDVHSDHEACGRAASTASHATGVPLWHYPVWTWHWAVPGDPRVPWDRAARVPLDEATRDRKRRALECFASQIHPLGRHASDAPILPPEELAHFARDYETVLR
ncbi:PIG-L family deacetylase [Streptomyces sp. ICBB 8177]|uniref:PIG-L deacetylase family protein n=1 Tax=Streptomyces sp. ICBB 8177 TaxID=563922 RepID=UPI000D67FFE5|nr:PIG-L family deacetylase [Streptomyces sp. ICBB 8177]PWI42923.1 PIG-L family deacetylase [Streptomyces sp. ICBB 8177]